jgi:hypothetical protein
MKEALGKSRGQYIRAFLYDTVILKWKLKKIREDMYWVCGLGYELVAGFCGHENDPSGSIKDWKFLIIQGL